MTRLIRTNLTPIVLVLLAVLPAVMGMSSSVVRCEHPGADTHLATNDHHAASDAGEVDPCCDHDAPADPDQPADTPANDEPCNDSPFEIELAPAPHAQHLDLGFADLPPLPVIAWTPADRTAIEADDSVSLFDLGPPALCARLAVVETTILRL